MMLPDPSLSLTIPSVQDHTVLDCRVYHPYSLSSNPKAPTWQRHAAILAHPYAPLGGCYDDPIVAEAAVQLLRSGYLVATFNFRGAAGSAGRTSWTAKPEGDDYMSVIGFIVYYIHYLDPFRPTITTLDGSLDPAAVPTTRPQQPSLLIGGYSYGSIITMQLPPLAVILERFASPQAGSAAAQIRLRAEHLATQYNEVLRSAREARTQKRGRSYARTGLRVGGDEEPGSPRRSGESERRSFSMDAEEKVRKSLHELFHRHKERGAELGHPTQSTHAHTVTEGDRLQAVVGLIIPRPSYLLISPIQGIARHLAIMDMWPSNSSRSQEINSGSGEMKLVTNPTLAVYGDRDGFVAASKLRTWATRLSTQEGSHFRAIEVRSAGHFWHEEGVLLQLQTAVEDFAKSLLDTN